MSWEPLSQVRWTSYVELGDSFLGDSNFFGPSKRHYAFGLELSPTPEGWQVKVGLTTQLKPPRQSGSSWRSGQNPSHISLSSFSYYNHTPI